jgi:hypothetical protein
MDDFQEIIDALRREHGRTVADIVVTLNERCWKRAWLIGCACGAGFVVAGRALLVWIGWI